MSSQPPPKPPTTSNRLPPGHTSGGSAEALSERETRTRSALLTLLQDTNWPAKSKDAAQKLVQTIDTVPDLPRDVTPVKDTVEELIRALETAHESLKEAPDRYGRKEGRFTDAIKRAIPSRRRVKWTDTLRTCQADIEKVSTTLRSRLESLDPIGSVEDSEIPSGHQNQPTPPLADVSLSLKPLESQGLQTTSSEQALTLENPTSQAASVQDSSPNVPKDEEKRSLIPKEVLTAARKVFKTVDAVSGTIPGVGSYVGAGAKVGLAIVNAIETMDQNENMAKGLTAHTSDLSKYLERIKKKSDAGQEDDLTDDVDRVRGVLEKIQKEVSELDCSGSFKKALLASDRAAELKRHQGAVQTALEEMQLLVSLKTSDLVKELKNSELRTERRRLLDRLGDGSYGARGNSIEDVVCLPGTRVDILDRIDQWIKDTSTSAERVLWIRGMAGCGKSTIASTVADSWASRGSCAIFHFRRGQNAAYGQFIRALARQLGKGLVPEVKEAILACVRENEDIAEEPLDQQFKILLVGSFDKLQDHAHPILIIVDALDECADVTDAVRFVRLIDQHTSLLPTSVKFLLTCRPEAPLIKALEPRKWHSENLDLAYNKLEVDIAVFIHYSFARIREDNDLPQTWPSSADVERIVEMSQGLFQWARTAITYIGDRSPDNRLREFLQQSSGGGKLDFLYHQILSKAFDEAAGSPVRRQLLLWVLEILVVAPYPVSLEVIAFLHADHEMFKDQDHDVKFLRDILADLNSLLHIPSSPSEPLRLMHTSIRDLLESRDRCENQPYFVDLVQVHRRLANVTLKIMGRDLRKNICELSDLSKANSEVQDAVERHVPKGLRYCCRSWSVHLTAGVSWSEANGAATSDIWSNFRTVSEEKLLAWLEVMSLVGASDEAFLVAKQVHQWVERWPPEASSGDLIILWNDARRFIASSLEPISFGALHIYASALPHCPVKTELWAKYGGEAATRILCGKRQVTWPANIWTSSFNSSALKVGFSPDGGVLACGMVDATVRLLDAQTGAQLGDPLTGHTGWISFVVFSPDGKVLASASDDNTVRLWDARTGEQLGDPLTGHTCLISSVVFSPDSKVLVAASDDGTARLWDGQTGAQLSVSCHTGSIMSSVFSPDGKILASGSLDRTVRLWDARTGAQLGEPLTGHTGWISSVLFSPDGKVLASGSLDRTVRLWDARTGAQLGDPLTGHTGSIRSVVFSPDGKVLASASGDMTVRLWDCWTGAQLGDALTGYTGLISSVVFSPDGKVLAAMSDDGTVRLCDARSGAQLGDPLTGHPGSIRSVVFSPDSKVLASASDAMTVQLWDTRTGAHLGDPLTGHTGSISSVVFSPDGKVLASASDDMTVQLWDSRTGAQLSDPLTSYTSSISFVVFSPDGKVMASRSDDMTVRLWDARTGAQLGDPLTGNPGSIRSVVFSPDGKVLASRSDDHTVRLWNARTGAQLGDPLAGHIKEIRSVVFSPDSKVLASVSDDKTIRLWDARTGAQLGDPLTGHTSSIRSSVFSPDGKLLASGSSDKTVRLWGAGNGAQLGDPLTGHTGWITSVVFSPDGKVLASAAVDMTVRLWDAWAGAQLGAPLIGHTGSIRSVVFSSDGKVLASASGDMTVRLWDGRTGAQLGDPLTSHTSEIVSVVFSPGNKPLAESFQIFTATRLSFSSSWIICGSRRLLWLPVHYRHVSQYTRGLRISFSQGRLVLSSKGILFLINITEYLDTYLM